MDDTDIQRAYYASTAERYEAMHAHEMRDLSFAVHLMLGMADFLGARTVLDIGSGTGRLLAMMKAARPSIAFKGVEPAAEMRALAIGKGLDVVDADGVVRICGGGGR